MHRLSQRTWSLILITLFGIAFAIFPAKTLQTDDASIYAATIRNVVVYHHWLLPTVDPHQISAFLDKPPVGIWLLSIIPALTGFSMLSLHATNVILWAVSAIVMTGFVAAFYSRNSGRWAGIILMTSVGAVSYSRSPKLEIPLMIALIAIHWGLLGWMKRKQPYFLYLTATAIAIGFLIKTGFAIVLPILTILGALLIFPEARQNLLPTLKNKHFWLASVLGLAIIALPLEIQYYAYPNLFADYLQSILFKSKYNIAYLGLGIHLSIILFLVLGILPWAAFLIRPIEKGFFKTFFQKPLTLINFAWVWIASNCMFLILAYQQVDFRTAVMILPPLAIVAARQIQARIPRVAIVASVGMVVVAAIIFALNPNNPTLVREFVVGIAVGMSLFWSLLFFRKHKMALMVLVATYSLFFAFESRLIPQFSPNYADAATILKLHNSGTDFVILRPGDRPLKMRSDLCFEDVLAGPANYYCKSPQEIPQNRRPKLVLTNPEAVSALGPQFHPIYTRNESELGLIWPYKKN